MMPITPQARDLLIRTVLGEAGGEGPQGWAAVAHVIKNRADATDGKLSEVIRAPKQFAMWSPGNPAGELGRKANANDPVYQRVAAVVDGVIDGRIPDPTGGADHYFAPGGMSARQGAPDWARGKPGQQIGNQVFYKLGGSGGGEPPGATAAATPTSGGGYTGRGLEGAPSGVDPRLVNILQAAAQDYPGFTVRVTSGLRRGDPRFHGKGMAADIELVGPDGKALPNYQDARSFRAYEQFAQRARQVQREMYPELDQQFRWGGYFSGPKGKYGAADTMHYDLGGSPRLGMAGGSWEQGLTQAQRNLFPGVESVGMTAAPAYRGTGVIGGGTAPAYAPATGSGQATGGFTGQPATTLASAPVGPAAMPPARSVQGSKSGWIMPDVQGRIGMAGPRAVNAAVPAETAGVPRPGSVVSQPLPPIRPATPPGARPTEPGGTPLPAFRPTEPGGTPLAPEPFVPQPVDIPFGQNIAANVPMPAIAGFFDRMQAVSPMTAFEQRTQPPPYTSDLRTMMQGQEARYGTSVPSSGDVMMRSVPGQPVEGMTREPVGPGIRQMASMTPPRPAGLPVQAARQPWWTSLFGF